MAKKRKSKKKQMKLNTDIKVILLILLGIVLAILIYGNSGYVGNFLNEILGGIMEFLNILFQSFRSYLLYICLVIIKKIY